MGGSVTQQSDFAMNMEIDALVEQIGALPNAPLAMPKQRLEAPEGGLLVWLAGANRIGAAEARRAGR